MICLALTVPGTVLNVISDQDSYTSPETISQDTYTPSASYGSPANLNIEQQDTFFYNGSLYVNYKVTKDSPYEQTTLSMEVTGSNPISDEESWDWINPTDLGFDCSEVWVTAVLPYLNEDEPDPSEIDLSISKNDSYTRTIQDYSYLLDDESVSDQKLLELYKENFPEDFPEVQVDSDSVSSQNGIVTYTLKVKKGKYASDYISSSVNIIYKKDGKVVYAASDYCSGTLSDNQKTFAYNPDHPVPPYDEVEVNVIS